MVEETAPEKRYSLFHPLVLSFYSADLYKEVAATWRARAFAYLLLLLALCWLPITVKLNQSLAEYVKTEVPEIAAGIPTITISHGEVFIDAPQPHVIYEPSSGQELAILDTTGQVTSLDGLEARLLLMKTSLVYAKSQYETRSWDLSEVEDFVLDEELVLWFFDLLSSWLVVLLYPLAVAASYIFRLALVPFYGGIGLLLSSILKTKLAFLNLCALAIVAMTPGLVAGVVLDLSETELPFSFLLFLLVTIGYLAFGIRSVAGAGGRSRGEGLTFPEYGNPPDYRSSSTP